ncbi:MAG: type 1 glutamine amidotransferase [Opitutales bacterium]
MRIHWLQHVPFEGLGMIEAWAADQGHELTATRFARGDALPLPAEVDMVIAMGGPMNALEDDKYPWLKLERLFLGDVIRAGKPVLGVCLGAQLIAAALGAKVYRHEHIEIGWWPVERTGTAAIPWPEEVEVFHWHSDTFDLPNGAEPLCHSTACEYQGFVWNQRVVGLQFHLEMRPEDVAAICENCGHEVVDGPWIQPMERLKHIDPDLQERRRRLLNMILDGLAANYLPNS